MMHPRNIYNKQIDFNELTKNYPEFAKVAKVDLNGKIKLDFSDLETKFVLTKCCLLKDFQLDVNLPKNRLCPTLPLRLNYIHFIEDLLDHCGIPGSSESVSGVDIGTGASSIYCLLAARLHKDWKMFGLEVDEENIKSSIENVTKNNLNDSIKIINQEGSDKIFQRLFEIDDSQKTFCLCNPPFYSDAEEMTEIKNRTGKRPKIQLEKPSHETITEGGELTFVTKILDESAEIRDKIKIYTTMFGCKRNFEKFISLLRERKIENFTTTRFVQGKVNRWAVAWSFCVDLKKFKDHLQKSSEKSTILKHVIEGEEISKIVEKVKEILSNLKIEINIVNEHKDKLYDWELKAVENTWSNQRRKRRAEQRNQEVSITTSTSEKQEITIGFEISKVDEKIIILTHFISGTMSKDCVNQILQFIKNKLAQK